MSQLIIGMLGYVYFVQVESDLSRNLVEIFQKYYFTENHGDLTENIDLIQKSVSIKNYQKKSETWQNMGLK
jgi:hypothetical protein